MESAFLQTKRFFLIFLMTIYVISTFGSVGRAAPLESIKEEFQTTKGVNYKHIQLVDGSLQQAVRIMEIDLTDPATTIQLGFPDALTTLRKTTTQALSYHKDGNYVVGAINGSFYDLYEIIGSPMNLVAKNNVLIHAGEVFTGQKDKYVNEPIAFGITESGKPVIAHYQLRLNYIHNGTVYEISGMNKIREAQETVLYTPSFPSDDTDTNEWGAEIAVELPSKPVLEFGKQLTGVVVDKRPYGEKDKKTFIPNNGFVISVQGAKSEQLNEIELGDEITLQVDIDDRWKNAEFMLASGPMLVNNGKKSVTMDLGSKNARDRHPRTAVAIDKTGEKVFFITVDGRQPGYSNGMTIDEFADYLVELGVGQALNLDGGGSTTMAVRSFGSDKISLANKPSDGKERGVWSILMAISSQPVQIFSDVTDSYWAHDEITEMFYEKIITGYPGGKFEPKKNLTRLEAAIMLSRAFHLDTEHVTDPGFKDIKPTDPYYREIAAVGNAGLFKGRNEGAFEPDGVLSRAEMAALIQRALNLPESKKGYYSDVEKEHWAFTEINSVAEHGIANGFPDGTFKPNEFISRAEFAALLYRTLHAGHIGVNFGVNFGVS